jgi:hypothetical protein
MASIHEWNDRHGIFLAQVGKGVRRPEGFLILTRSASEGSLFLRYRPCYSGMALACASGWYAGVGSQNFLV